MTQSAMGQRSSPPASFTGIQSHHGGFETSASSKKWGVGGDIDDSSSIITTTSKSSVNKQERDTQCKQCKEPHKATRQLFKCKGCRYKWHENCHNPTPSKSSEFWCTSCTKKKLRATAEQPSSFIMSYNEQGAAVLKETESKMKASAVCEKPGCNTPLFSAPSGGRALCTKHIIEEKHKQASNRPVSAPAPVSGSRREIDKSKLYPTRPDDRQFMNKSTKRKRPSSGELVPSMRVHPATKDKQVKSPLRPPSSRSTKQNNFGVADRAQNVEILNSPTRGIGISLHSPSLQTSMYEGNLEFLRSGQDKASRGSLTGVALRLDSARATPLSANYSPDYSPPPPNLPAENTNPWNQDDHSGKIPNSPGSQIEQELRHDADITEQLRNRPTSNSDLPVNNGNDDQPNSETLAHINQLVDEQVPVGHPSLSLQVEESNAVHEPTTVLEVARRNFNPQTLDSFLTQPEEPELEPDARQLLRTQNWGAVDPRLAWPKRLSSREREEKLLEIEARPPRKVNFGKLLTPEVRQERYEKGWDIHQNSEFRDNEEIRERVVHLQELFGVSRMDEFIPATRSHRLVMLEREEPETIQTGARRRKKVVTRKFIMREY